MQTLLRDLRYGARMSLKKPGFTLIAVITLALGIGANAAIFTVVNGVLLRPLPYDEPDRLVMLWESDPRRNIERQLVAPPNLVEWREQSRSFENIAYWSGSGEFNLVMADGIEKGEVRLRHVRSFLDPARQAASRPRVPAGRRSTRKAISPRFSATNTGGGDLRRTRM